LIFQNAGVKFPQRPHVIPKEHPISSNDNKNNPCVGELAASYCGKNAQQPETEKVPDSRYYSFHFPLTRKEK